MAHLAKKALSSGPPPRLQAPEKVWGSLWRICRLPTAPLSIPGLQANDRSSAPQAFLGPQAGNTGKTSRRCSTYQRSSAQRPQARISSVVPPSQASSTERCQLPLVQVETESQKED